MAKHLLLFTIGPVQPFIAQARKTRDLWVGSFLISSLMEAALQGLGGELVFPTKRQMHGNIADLPNKFVALFESAQQASAEADQAKKRLEERWQELADAVWRHIFVKALADDETHRIWERQTNSARLFEFYWVVVTRRPGEVYGVWYKRAQQALDDRKRLRDFAQQHEPGEKSTISGEREALHNTPQTIKTFWSYIAQHYKEAQISHDGSERLDAIDTIKRFAPLVARNQVTWQRDLPKQSFPSTSSVAIAPFVEELLTHAEELAGALAAWRQVTAPLVEQHPADPETLPYLYQLRGNQEEILRRDGDCLFVETFTSKRLKEEYGLSPEEAERLAKTAPSAVNALRKAAIAAGVRPPSPYYAVLVMDGDRMGELLGKVREEDEHVSISKTLSTFSRETVPDIVEHKYPARLVYAGGDDVMALVPLRDMLKVSNAVQQSYREAMRRATAEPVKMSAGIAIAHYLDPLSHVLREARRAEDQAKERYGRNALVVTLLRRSGEPTTVGCYWQYDGLDEQSQPLTLFPLIADLLDQDIVSTNFVYNLAEEAATLSRLSSPAQESEIRRLLLRGTDDKKLASLGKEQQGKWRELPGRLAHLAAAMDLDRRKVKDGVVPQGAEQLEYEYRQVDLWYPGPRRGLVEISGWLLLLSFSLRGGRD